MTIECRAAIATAVGAPLEVGTVSVAPPGPGEVLIEIVATGICHTDLTAIEGTNKACVYPAILGHEGAGRVVDIGAGVTSVVVGDHVVPLYGPECGACAMCMSRRTNLCWSIKPQRDRGLMPDGSVRFRWREELVHHFMGTSTFSRYTVVPEIAVAKIRRDLPFEHACLLGCGVTTGVGAALANVRAGDDVVVFGLGGIGMNIVQGARIAGAKRIIGVDRYPSKAALARKLGATDFLDAGAGLRETSEAVLELTRGGADVAFECTGIVTVMRQALDCSRAGWGTCVLLGVEPHGAEMAFPPAVLRYGRTIKGSYFGDVRGRTGLGRIADLCVEGAIELDALITHRLPLDRINEGFEMMVAGTSLRSVVVFE
ncbi:MAG: hypothetical protein RL227_245 [Pseudomonadota bacterium]|jgi:S-(hydroxymethyl)glutathione dehydrogenase/alcohol dehydrogenase